MRKLNQLVPEAEKELATEQLAAAVDLANAIRPRAPVGEGEYARSLEGARLADKPQAAVLGSNSRDKNATGVFADHRWRWLDFGTAERVQKTRGRRVGAAPAQPHIFPTFRAKRKAIRRKMAGAVNKAVRRVKGK
jgi:hypothetical protein